MRAAANSIMPIACFNRDDSLRSRFLVHPVDEFMLQLFYLELRYPGRLADVALYWQGIADRFAGLRSAWFSSATVCVMEK